MKTLGIFGDSFASQNPSRPTSIPTAWPNQLDRERWTITNYARASTSFYWTYRLFLEHHHRYDQVVCIVTRPGRVTIRNAPHVIGIPFGASGINQCIYLLNQKIQRLTHEQRKTIEAIRDYMMYAQDFEYEVDAAVQLLEHLRRVRPDAIFIPISPVLPNLCPPEYPMMMDFTRIIINSLKPEMIKEFFPSDLVGAGWIPKDEHEPIQCHMTPEVNTLVARCVEAALTLGQWAPTLPTTVEHSLQWDDYYKATRIFDI